MDEPVSNCKTWVKKETHWWALVKRTCKINSMYPNYKTNRILKIAGRADMAQWILSAFGITFLVVFSPVAYAGKAADTRESAETFLETVRRPPVQECWAKLNGMIKYRAKGIRTQNFPIGLRASLNDERLLAEVLFADNQAFHIKQYFSGSARVKKVAGVGTVTSNSPHLGELGLNAEDLTLSFLYWDFVKELPTARVRGQRCRVLKMLSPDESEYAIVSVSTKYHFPLQVLWYRSGASDVHRKLEFTGFKKINDMWVMTELRVRGISGKSVVTFTDNIVEPVTPESAVPEDLFVNDFSIDE